MVAHTHIKHAFCLPLFLIAATLVSNHVAASDWPQWRGPNHNGASDATGLPTEWSATKNVKWTADLPGMSSATPIISGDNVFVASNDESMSKLYAMCLDRNSGSILWKKLLSDSAKASSRNNMASCSPVTDGKLVYFLFGSGDFYALDLKGETVWSKHLGEDFGRFAQQWGYSSSPVLYNEKLFVTVLRGTWAGDGTQDEDSYLMCLEPSTGDVVYRVHRASDALAESQDSYVTPIPFEYKGHSEIVLAGADYITGHDASTGKELWRHGHNARKIKNWRLIPSPVIANELVIGVVPRGGNAFAIDPSAGKNMAYEDAAWVYDSRTTDVPTPLFYEGRLYLLNGARQVMMCVDPATGKEIWSGDMEGRSRMWASPTAADGKIYCLDESGTTTVLAAGDEFKILGRSSLGGGPCKSSIALADNQVFVRTAEKLYCIGK
jgi:outer membrane protein assembly factor BamB